MKSTFRQTYGLDVPKIPDLSAIPGLKHYLDTVQPRRRAAAGAAGPSTSSAPDDVHDILARLVEARELKDAAVAAQQFAASDVMRQAHEMVRQILLQTPGLQEAAAAARALTEQTAALSEALGPDAAAALQALAEVGRLAPAPAIAVPTGREDDELIHELILEKDVNVMAKTFRRLFQRPSDPSEPTKRSGTTSREKPLPAKPHRR